MIEYLDSRKPIALYYQLKQLFIRKIVEGEWKAGERIPSEFEICEQYEISRITVRQALAELVKEGYLIKKQGKGTFVSIPKIEQNLMSFYSLSQEFKKRGFTPHTSVLEFRLMVSDKKVQKSLKLEKSQSQVYFVKRLRYADNILMAIEDTYLPAYLFKGLTKEILESAALYDIMRGQYEIVPGSAEESFGACLLDEASAELFGIEVGAPALDIERLTYCGERCIEYTKGIIRGDKFRFHVNLK